LVANERLEALAAPLAQQARQRRAQTGELVVGTGGDSHFDFLSTVANSVVRNADIYGVLKLTLHPTSFDWKFLPDTQSGTFTDAGCQACHL
jgi:hypothetical protein